MADRSLEAARGWRVVGAGLGINLVLGVLYSWSVLSKKIPADWNWTEADRAKPYAVACLVFSIAMAFAGRLQDPKTTSLHPRDIARCLRLKVWDVAAQRMVGL